MSEIKWQEPPAARGGQVRGKGRWQLVLEELKRHPGAWALVGEAVSTSTANHLKKLGLEVTSRNITPDRRCDVYARWPEAGAEA